MTDAKGKTNKDNAQGRQINIDALAKKMSVKGNHLLKPDENTDKDQAQRVEEYLRSVNKSIAKIMKSDAALTEEMLALLQELYDNAQAAQGILIEIDALAPYLNKELEKPEYNGATIEDLLDNYEIRDLQNLPEDSLLYKALDAARQRAAVIESQKAGRAIRVDIKKQAEENSAVMTLKGGNYPIFSSKDLWDAFAPGRICKMGTLDRSFIDKETGYLNKTNIEHGELITLDAQDIPIQAFMLLNAIQKNTAEDPLKTFVKDGAITFYVKGILDTFTEDPRTLLNIKGIDRKTAGVLYLEEQFKPLQEYIGTTFNGSRYSVFNYIGYDAATDTMTIQTPYLYQLWIATQQAYLNRQENLRQAINAGKRPSKKDMAPLKINSLFKDKAINEDPITLEIAVYITNVLLNAGTIKKQKKTEILYKTIIKECPRLNQRLNYIENEMPAVTDKGEKRNLTGVYNAELRKIKNAINLILNPAKCDAHKLFTFESITPAKEVTDEKGNIISFDFIAPTKSIVNNDGKLIILWSGKQINTN